MRSVLLLASILAATGCGVGTPTNKPQPPVEPVPLTPVANEVYDKVAPMPREKGTPAPQ